MRVKAWHHLLLPFNLQATSSEKSIEEKTPHLLNQIFADCSLEKVGIRLWDGTQWPDGRSRAAVVVLKHAGALGRMFLPGSEVGLAEAYLDNDFVIEGDIEAAFEIGDFLLNNLGDWKGAFQKLERARLPWTNRRPRFTS